jgi:hypothetical protein
MLKRKKREKRAVELDTGQIHKNVIAITIGTVQRETKGTAVSNHNEVNRVHREVAKES